MSVSQSEPSALWPIQITHVVSALPFTVAVSPTTTTTRRVQSIAGNVVESIPLPNKRRIWPPPDHKHGRHITANRGRNHTKSRSFAIRQADKRERVPKAVPGEPHLSRKECVTKVDVGATKDEQPGASVQQFSRLLQRDQCGHAHRSHRCDRGGAAGWRVPVLALPCPVWEAGRAAESGEGGKWSRGSLRNGILGNYRYILTF